MIQEEEESHQHVIDILTECVAGVHESEHWLFLNRAQELCESRGGRPGLPVPNIPYGLCGRKPTLNLFISYDGLWFDRLCGVIVS